MKTAFSDLKSLFDLKSRREPLSWDEKLLIFAFPTLLLVAAIAQFSLRRDAPVALVNYPAPAALPNPNGFDAYLAAETMIKLDLPAVDPIDDAGDLIRKNPQLAAQKYSLANKKVWLGANAAGFQFFRQAQTLACQHPAIVPGGFGSFNYALHNQLRQLARYKVIEINAFKMQKNWNGAVTSALDTIQMGNDIAIGGALAAKFAGSGIEAMGRGPLTDTVDPISKLSAAQVRAAGKRLEALLKRRFSYTATLQNERWSALREFDFITQQPNWQSYLMQSQGREVSWREKMGFLSNPKTQIVGDINRIFDQNLADMKKPFSAPFVYMEPANPMSQNFAFGGQSYRTHEASEVVSLNILLLRLALRVFEAENGRFPAQLSELSPRILSKIPTDDFADGAPLRYLNQGKKYRLYSVGPDGKDDKATPIKEKYGRIGRNQFGLYPALEQGNRGDYVAGINH